MDQSSWGAGLGGPSRRGFWKRSARAGAGGALVARLDPARFAHAAGGETIKIGFVGCGNRGTGACREALSTKGPVQLVAIGDLFADRLETSLKNLCKYPELRARIDVPQERKFVGFDAYQEVIDSGVDLVLLTTPPHFRPIQYAAAVRAGKHVFMEKPCCVDAPGFRVLVAANQQAKAKRLSVVVGLQRRHQRNYREAIQRIRDGAVGQIRLIRTYFNMPGGGRSGLPRPDAMSEMEYQIRHWALFCWLGGDHLVEQACHEIDVANWIMDAHPLRASGMGGRQVRTGPGTGDIWDHHAVEFEYPGGVRHFCQARQQPGTWSHVSDTVHGTKGTLTLGTGPWGLGALTPRELRAKGYTGDNPYQQEHDDLLASIRGDGPYAFEGDYAAASSMTAVMGRMATYSGQVVTWEEAVRSELSLAPKRYALDADPPTTPDPQGVYPTAMPGMTRAW
ncbi:MAG: Gfo/Idh/MocA family protein [Thermoguttaceae bacterium]